MQFAKGYTVYRQKSISDSVETIATIPLRKSTSISWIHDFPATKNYAIVVETPCVYNIASILLGTQAEADTVVWNPREKTFIYLVPLQKGRKVGA